MQSGASQSTTTSNGAAKIGLHQTWNAVASAVAAAEVAGSSCASNAAYAGQSAASPKRSNRTSANAAAMNVPITYCTENQLRIASASANVRSPPFTGAR